jgi:uncharacterized protein YggE
MKAQENAWKIAGVVGILLTIFLAVLSVKEIKSISYVGANANQNYTISVDGSGEAIAVPDIATISFTVTETAKTVSAAQEAATKKVNATVDAIKAAGIAEKDIKTTSYSINPHYDYEYDMPRCINESMCPPATQKITGYDVSQSTEIKIRDLKKVGDLFTLIGSKDVQNVYGPSFDIENKDALKAQAREEAINKAQAKAEALAKALGVSLVRIVNFSENGGGYYPLYGMGGDMVSAKAVSAPEISTGEQKISSNVSIVYEIR